MEEYFEQEVNIFHTEEFYSRLRISHQYIVYIYG